MNWVWPWISTASVAALAYGCTDPLAEQLPVAKEIVQKPAELTVFDGNQLTIPLELPAEFSGAGGAIAADVAGSNQMEILVSQPNYVAAYDLTAGKLWAKTVNIRLSDDANNKGLPGPSASGLQAGDIDEDGNTEVLYVTENNQLEVLSGVSGELKYQIDLPKVKSAFGGWEQAVIADFSGAGDFDLLLQASQATNKEDYFRDSIQAAFSIEDLLSSGAETEPLWIENNFVSLSHGAAKVVDLDGDGKDEVVGAMVLGSDGQVLHSTDVRNTAFPHIDSIAIGDIMPDKPGLEVVIPEENGKERVFLFDEEETIWVSPHRQKSPDDDGDKVAIGNFDPNSPGLEMWFRGNESAHFTVLGASGEVIADYAFDEVRPKSWTEKGFEMINRIRWSGDDKEYIAVKERHEAGDAGIFDAITGELIVQMPAQTQRLYVVDILGDWREEIVVIDNDNMNVYENTQTNPNPDRPRLWEQAQYRRQKMTGDYYSP